MKRSSECIILALFAVAAVPEGLVAAFAPFCLIQQQQQQQRPAVMDRLRWSIQRKGGHPPTNPSASNAPQIDVLTFSSCWATAPVNSAAVDGEYYHAVDNTPHSSPPISSHDDQQGAARAAAAAPSAANDTSEGVAATVMYEETQADMGPKPPQRTAIARPIRDRVREEQVARALLQTRLLWERQSLVEMYEEALIDVGPKPPQRTAIARPSRDHVREEQVARALLQTRLLWERHSLAQRDMGPRPPLRNKEQGAAVPSRDYIREEQYARALLMTRLQLESKIRVCRRQQELERTQRALLSTRLQRDMILRTQEMERVRQYQARQEAIQALRQPAKCPEEASRVKDRYASIANLSDRAFAILLDLGMLDETQET